MTLEDFVNQVQGNLNLSTQKIQEVVVEIQYYVEFGVWTKPEALLGWAQNDSPPDLPQQLLQKKLLVHSAAQPIQACSQPLQASL